MYRSTHKRNVRGMRNAPRCNAYTKAGNPCRGPAVNGTTRCHNHGGLGAKGKSWGRRLGDYAKANLVRDKVTSIEIRRIDKVIRKLRREGGVAEIIEPLQTARQNLLRQTQQKEAEWFAQYEPPPSEQEAQRIARKKHSYLNRCSDHVHRSLAMIRDRARGAILGLAMGEAVGITGRGFERDSYRTIHDMLGGGRFGLRPGEWADGTASALALMDSLIWRKGFDETDFIERLIDWRDEGAYSCTGTCVRMDVTTRDALEVYQVTGDPVAGDTHLDNLCSASLVRLSPVAIRYWSSPTARSAIAMRQCLVTHGSAVVVDANIAFSEVLADAICGESRARTLSWRELRHATLAQGVMDGSWIDKHRDNVRSDNQVLDALEAALWCVTSTHSFEDAVVLAANLGGETAKIGALAGQLAGALYGERAIPVRWLEWLAWRERIGEEADVLFESSVKG